MSTKLVFLGTSASNPTVERNLTATALHFQGAWMLFDCPEGTQRQMIQSGVSYMKISHIFISHFHADHVLGLPGLLATMSMHGRDYPLYVYGPKGIASHVKKALELALLAPGFEIVTKELRKGTIVKDELFSVSCIPLKHEIPCFGFSFKEADKMGEFQREKAVKLGIPEGPLWAQLQKGKKIKVKGKQFSPDQVLDYTKARTGKKISIIMDTLAFAGIVDFVNGSDVLVHEATFLEKMKARAKETKHSTAQQAARIAEKAKCKKLVLTHISPRHKSNEDVENEARQEFGNVVVATDLLELDV